MRDCGWPIGFCPQQTWDGDTSCFYHRKILLGLFEPTPAASMHINPADVLSDEQLELVGVLEVLWVERATISNALTRRMASA